MKIGILGGAFDPPTLAHTEIITSVLKSNIVNNIWMMPTYNHIESKNTRLYYNRMRMCKIAVENLKDSRIKVSNFEKLFPLAQTTWEIFKNLKDRFNNHEFYMIIGSDRAKYISVWHNWEQLIDEVPFIIINRELNNQSINDYSLFDPSKHKFLNLEITPNISSTLIRNHLEDILIIEENNIENVIDLEVYEYAKKIYNQTNKCHEKKLCS